MKHLLAIEELTKEELLTHIKNAASFVEVGTRDLKKVPALRGKTIINMFMEPSTRTRASFEIAGKRLSADVINIGGSESSTSKGETLLDTARTLQAMAPDVLVVRHKQSGAAHFLARRLERTAVVNAGDGLHEHPTQALLDALTIRRRKGRIEGLTVAICGDILHSRVARSNILLLLAMGARVRAVAIGFLYGFVSSEHEDAARRIVEEEHPDAFVCSSHEVAPEFREYERISTAVVNSYLGPVMQGYIRRLAARLTELGSSDYEQLQKAASGFVRLTNNNRLVGGILSHIADDHIVLEFRSNRVMLPRSALPSCSRRM